MDPLLRGTLWVTKWLEARVDDGMVKDTEGRVGIFIFFSEIVYRMRMMPSYDRE